MAVLKTSLAIEYPEIAKEWHPTKNGELTPADVAPHSNKKVWWICPRGHEYETTPDKKTGRNAGCPYCSGKKVLAGFNDLATVLPDLAKEWEYSLNGDLTPQMVVGNSHKRIWWKCSVCGHTWEATVNDRFRNRGCPMCARETRTVKRRATMLKPGINDLKSQRPDLLLEWDYEKNTNAPSNYSIRSNEKVWWRCPVCGLHWQAIISNRASLQSGCPRCMKHKQTSFPEQAILFYLKQLYPDAINSYTDIFDSTKTELDIFIPDLDIGIEYDGAAWHANKRARNIAEKKYLLCQENGIRLIRVSELPEDNSFACDLFILREDNSSKGLDSAISALFSAINLPKFDINTERDRAEIMRQYITTLKEKSIAAKCPEIVHEWDIDKNDGITAEMVNANSVQPYWWICPKGHSYQSAPYYRLQQNYGCPICSNHQLLRGYNDLKTLYPEVVDQWDYEKNAPKTPESVKGNSESKYWWICPEGHSYRMSVKAKAARKIGCPICANRQVLPGYNDLSSLNPKVAEMWDYERNGTLTPSQVMPGNGKKVWWVCEKGHHFSKTISLQNKSPSCPICGNRQLLVGFNDLATTHPNLAKEWNYEKNHPLTPRDVMPSSSKKVWWSCSSCGNEWQTQINLRILSGIGCPKCGYSKKMQETRSKNIKENKQDLISLFPEIAKEWDYERNAGLDPSQLMPGSNKKVWWICPKGHHYQAWMGDRTGKRKTGCPYCARKRKLPDQS